MSDPLAHCLEWCEHPANGDTHEDTCPDATITMTKREFVNTQEAAAGNAISDYEIMLEHEEPPKAKESVIEAAHEAAVCFVGIGSCGRGWCKHS